MTNYTVKAATPLATIMIVVGRNGWGEREPTDAEQDEYRDALAEALEADFPDAEVLVRCDRRAGSNGSRQVLGNADEADVDNTCHRVWAELC